MASDIESSYSVITQPYSQLNLEIKPRSGTRGELGGLYEMKILALVLYRALKDGYDFTLGTNIEGVGAFDDVVFTYKESDGIEQRIYLQAKHKEAESRKIKYEDLLKEGKGEYTLHKYFIDYVEIILKFREIKNKYFIIYTNIDFQCEKANDRGFRTHKKSQTEYFVFRKVDLTEFKPLGIFSISDSNHSEKFPAFYQFSDTNQNGEDEKSRVVDFLERKFKNIDEKKKMLPKLSENELKSMLEGFFDSLIFAVDQLDQEKLGNQVKEEIKRDHSDSLTQEHVNYIFEYSFNKVSQWKLDNTKPLTENDNFFAQGEKKFKTFPAIYPTLVLENELSAYGIRFKNEKYEELNKFISSKAKLWFISSNASWLSSLVIYQSLNQENLKNKTGINYAKHDVHIFLTWIDLLREPELLLDTLKTMKLSLLIIACESTKPVDLKASEIVNKISDFISASDLKKVIIIARENFALSKRLKQKITSSYDKQYVVKFGDLTPESQKTCLTTKKILFQGQNELVSIQELLSLDEQFLESEETLTTKLNLNVSELETLLKDPVVEIGNEHSKLSHLDSAYYKTSTLIDFKQLKDALKANSGDIFAIVAEEDDIEFCLSDLQQPFMKFDDVLLPANEGFILLNKEKYEEQFKQLCYQVDDVSSSNSLHLLRKSGKGWLWTQTYSRNFYMERTFYPVVVDVKKLKDTLIQQSRLFYIIFSGIKKEALLDLLNIEMDTDYKRNNFSKNMAVFLEEIDAENEFYRLGSDSNQYEKSVHWLKIVETGSQKQIRWNRSQGDVSQLRGILMTDGAIETKFTEADFTNSTERIVVLSDEPGMGKTTSLLHISEFMKNKNPLSWVIKFDLNQYQEIFATEQVETMDDFVELFSSIDRKFADPITRRFLMYRLTCPGHVILLWDGFDEVITKRQDAILRLFKFIKAKTAATLWVTTRRHDEEKLEECLSVLAHTFEPQDIDQQVNFLSHFWSMTLKLVVQNVDTPILKSYANKVIQGFELSIQTSQENTAFISVPLRARMIAEVFQAEIKEVLTKHNTYFDVSKVVEHFTIGTLFEKFIARMYDIYFDGKVMVSDRLPEKLKGLMTSGCTKEYQILALKNLFDSDKIKDFMDDRNQSFDLNLLSQIGLIQGNKEPVNFIHRTFAEYFAAQWLAEHTKCPKVKKFLGVQLFKNKCAVVRRFYDYFLSQNLQLHRSVLKGYPLDFLELSEICDMNLMDDLGRTALHLAAQEDRNEMIQYLQCLYKESAIKFTRDQVGKTALHYAARFSSTETIELLLKNVIDIDLNEHILRLPLNFDTEIGNSIFNKPEYARSKLVELVNEQDEADRTALYYAAENENWYAACTLLSHGANVSVLTKEQKGELLRFVTAQLFSHIRMKFSVKCNVQAILVLLSVQIPKDKICEYFGLLSPRFEYGITNTIDSLLRMTEKEEERFQITNEPYNFCPLFRIIIRCRLLSESYTSRMSDVHYLQIVTYFCKNCRELGLEIREDDIYEFLRVTTLLRFSETFSYLCKYGEKEIVIFRPEKIRDNMGAINGLIYNIQDLNYDNPWLQNLISVSCEVFGWTRLHLASMNKNVDPVNFFLNFRIDENINSKDIDGDTPLVAAARNGNSKFIESFFKELKAVNCDKNQFYKIINDKNNIYYGRAPLHRVIDNGDFDSIKVLLKSIKDIGFNQNKIFDIVNSRDSFDANPIKYIHNMKSGVNTVEILKHVFHYIQSFNFSSQQCLEILKGSQYLLYRFITYGCEKEALSLLRCLEKLPLRDSERAEIVNEKFVINSDTPLHAAANTGCNHEIILHLLKNGAVFNAYNSSQKTSLDLIVEMKTKLEMHLKKAFQFEERYTTDFERFIEILKKQLEMCQKTEFLLSSISKLFVLTADEQIMEISEKLYELKVILNEIKYKSWIEPESILNARNREGKTLISLSHCQEVTDLLRGLKHNLN